MFDMDGRHVRTIVTRDPEWDDTDRTWMLALALREESECRRCGGDLAETLDYAWKWQPQPPVVCLRCVALDADKSRYEKHPQRAGMIHQVHKVPRPRPNRRKRKR